jgi:UDP-N-acetylglucosamine 2-epimerase (non-hydrolysing)
LFHYSSGAFLRKELNRLIAIIVGTRPEIIKMCPIIRECERRKADYYILHTGQHYSYAMDRIFFEELELPQSRHNLEVGSGTHGRQTGRMIEGIESVLTSDRCDLALVQGDTNTVLAGAIAASKLGIRIGHVEAGLRSFDRTMPEEINRVVADHVSDYLFAPTGTAVENLKKEGITRGVYETGNTIVDSVRENLEIAQRKSKVLTDLDLEPRSYILVTAHRQENVDDPARLGGIVAALRIVGNELALPVIFPAHPRTVARMKAQSVSTEGLRVITPLGFLDFLQLESKARLVLTDSGGVQEETCILHVPCVTMRQNTERPETVEVGSNLVAGTDPDNILAAAKEMAERPAVWTNPFGDGTAARRIIDIVG